jgi:glycosyltransferase involved in cell wall biosynthesis
MEKLMDTRIISIVIPLLDERENLVPLYSDLQEVLESNNLSYEIIFIDDGSTDGSDHVLEELHAKDARVKVVQFRKNFGKAAALSAGFEKAVGDVVITMDADLQDNPKEIMRFLEKIEEGYDLVSGWKKVRHDPIAKTLPSRIFNNVVSRITRLKMHDINCGFKAYRKEAIEELNLYGELHRFIPTLVSWRGFKVAEIEVEHSRRKYGKSKYGVERLAKGFFDLLTVLLLTKYSKRPLHFFGTAGMILSGTGFLILAYLSILWFLGLGPIGTRPLLFFGILLLIFGLQVATTGLIGELITRSFHKKGSEYSIKKTFD